MTNSNNNNLFIFLSLCSCREQLFDYCLIVVSILSPHSSTGHILVHHIEKQHYRIDYEGNPDGLLVWSPRKPPEADQQQGYRQRQQGREHLHAVPQPAFKQQYDRPLASAKGARKAEHLLVEARQQVRRNPLHDHRQVCHIASWLESEQVLEPIKQKEGLPQDQAGDNEPNEGNGA